MAMLVAVGGAALGAATGLGWGTGWLAGSVLGNLLFPAKGQDSRVEGPRLGDLTVTSAANGAPVGIGFGTLRMAGNLIWSSGIREKKNVERAEAGKGGGGASQTAVSYAYFASFAIAFGEGPAEDVLRLWADGKLIFDKTGSRPVMKKPSAALPLPQRRRNPAARPADRGRCRVGPRTRTSRPGLPGRSRTCRSPTSATESPTSPPRSPSAASPPSPTSPWMRSTRWRAAWSPVPSRTSSRSTGAAARPGWSTATSTPRRPACAGSTSPPCARTARRG